MPPPLALLLTTLGVLVLFRLDSRAYGRLGALWIPVIWLVLSGSRFLGQWLAILQGGSADAPDAMLEDGSAIDRVVFSALIILGILVLRQRRVRVRDVVRSNVFLSAFLLYCFLAIFWSDFPYVALKRYIKVIGHPVMALIVLTEPDVTVGLRRLMKSVGIVLVAYSITLIKYFPQVGRGFDTWTGSPVNRGVSTTKNELGYVCMVFGLFFLWNLLNVRLIEDRSTRRDELLVSGLFLGSVVWLLMQAQSATSTACLVGGGLLMVLLQSRLVSKRYIWLYAVVGLLILGMVQSFVNLSTVVMEAFGRDATLTDRTEVWADVLRLAPNPLIGAGFESFWLGPRLDQLHAKWWWKPTQAHNGYIETYLNLGWIGVALFAGMFLWTLWRAGRQLVERFEIGQFQLVLLVILAVYNITEATFKGIHPLWTLFTIAALSAIASKKPEAARQGVTSRGSSWQGDLRPRLTGGEGRMSGGRATPQDSNSRRPDDLRVGSSSVPSLSWRSGRSRV
jgi:O-antigen ligase